MALKLIVSGPPRCGTTILADVISRHERVALTIESDFARVVTGFDAAFSKIREHQAFWDTTNVLATGESAPAGHGADIYHALAAKRREGVANLPAWKNPAPMNLQKRFERLLTLYYRDATGKADAAWIGDKMPDVFAKTALAQAMEIVDGVHFIYIFRNPLAMIASSGTQKRKATLRRNFHLKSCRSKYPIIEHAGSSFSLEIRGSIKEGLVSTLPASIGLIL